MGIHVIVERSIFSARWLLALLAAGLIRVLAALADTFVLAMIVLLEYFAPSWTGSIRTGHCGPVKCTVVPT